MTDQRTKDEAAMTAFDEALKAIADERAVAHALWVLLSDESERDGYALKPLQWEGPGEYQHVRYDDGRDGFVRIPPSRQALPIKVREPKVRIRVGSSTAKDEAASVMLGALKEVLAVEDRRRIEQPAPLLLSGALTARVRLAFEQARAAIAAAEAAGIRAKEGE